MNAERCSTVAATLAADLTTRKLAPLVSSVACARSSASDSGRSSSAADAAAAAAVSADDAALSDLEAYLRTL